MQAPTCSPCCCCLQHIDGRCSFPHSVCFTAASLDDKPLSAGMLQDPLGIRLPKHGIFKVCRHLLLTAYVQQVMCAMG